MVKILVNKLHSRMKVQEEAKNQNDENHQNQGKEKDHKNHERQVENDDGSKSTKAKGK